MVNYQRLREEDIIERQLEYRGETKLVDTPRKHVPPLHARFGDNGVVQFVVLTNQRGGGPVYVQGTMMQQLADAMAAKFGIVGKAP